MTWLPYAVAAWLFAIGLYGIASSRNLIHLVGCVGMGAHRGIDVVILLRQRGGVPGGFQAAAGVHQKPNALTRQGGEQLLPVGIKSPVVHMGMGIK